MAAPLYSALTKHRDKNRASFHTPGHKGNPNALPGDLLGLDYTELPDTDSLFEASGPILEAERLASRLFHTERTCISAGGCTLCIQAMLRLAVPQGGSVLCSRAIHRGAVNAMALLGLEPVWAMPGDVASAVRAHPDVKAIYVTSPDYYGRILDIPDIAAASRERGVPLLVDCAHGAHLMFTEPKLHPLLFGASMTADSAHKTLGVLTGGAWLNIADGRYADGAKEAMALFGSTSPSYPVMASLDLCREWLETRAGAFAPLQERVSQVKERALERGIALPGGLTDPTRVTLDTASIGLSGTRAAELFRAAGVEPEYADGSFVVLIATPFSTENDFERLVRAVEGLPKGDPLPERPEFPPLPTAAASLRETLFAEKERVPLGAAVGRTAADTACPCPPGIPVVMPGERITREAVEFLGNYGFFYVNVIK